MVNSVRGETQAKEVADGSVAKGGKAEILGFDVADTEASESAIAAAAKKHGGLDIVVSNAGGSIDGLILRLKNEDIEKTLAVNVGGAFAIACAALRVMFWARTG